MKAYLIGDRETVISFKLAGVEGFIVDSPEEMFRKIETLMERKDVLLILVTENFSSNIRDKIYEIRLKKEIPLICEVPSRAVTKKKRVIYREILKKALGVSI